MMAMLVVGLVMTLVVMNFGGSGKVEGREKGFKGRIAVDERGSNFDEGSKREDEKRKECDEVGREGRSMWNIDQG